MYGIRIHRVSRYSTLQCRVLCPRTPLPGANQLPGRVGKNAASTRPQVFTILPSENRNVGADLLHENRLAVGAGIFWTRHDKASLIVGGRQSKGLPLGLLGTGSNACVVSIKQRRTANPHTGLVQADLGRLPRGLHKINLSGQA
jgi:hypothetical protein